MGGIAGQLVPEVRLLYNEGQVGDLLDELDVLRGLIDQTGDDVRRASDEISERMKAISDRAGEAQEAMSNLMDSTADWANENIDEINDLSARLSRLTDETAPILDDTSDALDLAEELAGQLNDVLDEGRAAGEIGADTAAEAEHTIQALRSSLRQARASRDQLQSALDHLKQVLGRGEDTGPAVEAFFEAFGVFAEDCGGAAGAAAQALRILWDARGPEGMTEEQREAWDSALAGVQSGLAQAASALPELG